MSIIHIKHHHSLKHDETRERVERVATQLGKKYRVNYQWQRNLLHSRHKGSSASVYLGDGYIELKIKLSLFFTPLKGKIENAIRGNLHGVVGDINGAPARITLFERV